MTKEQLRKNWRRGFAVALTAAMVANSTLPSTIFAAEFTAPDEITQTLPENIQTEDENADFGDGEESTEDNFSTGTENTSSAQTSETEASEAVKTLQEQINTLPTVEEFQAMADGTTVEDSNLNQKQTDVYNEAQAIADALNQLSEEEQGQVDTSKLEALFGYFNSMTDETATTITISSAGTYNIDGSAPVYISATGNVTLNLTGNMSLGLSGGLINVSSACNVTINSNGHTVENTMNSNAIFLGNSSANVTVNGGTYKVAGTKPVISGEGKGTLQLNGCIIHGGGSGGSIYVKKLTMKNTTVENSPCGITGENMTAINCMFKNCTKAMDIWNGDSVTLSGNTVFSGNTNDIYLRAKAVVSLSDDYNGNAKVTTADTVSANTRRQITTANTSADMLSKISSANSKYTVNYDTSGKYLYLWTHSHTWSYTAKGNTITATCTSDKKCGYYSTGLTATLTATNQAYSGKAYTGASVKNNITAVTGATAGAIKYVGRDETSYTESTTAPTNAGKYTAKVTISGQTASADFEITKAKVTKPTADPANFVYNGQQQTYNIANSDLYTVTGNTQTDVETYTVTVSLKDKTNSEWSDGSTDDLKFTFEIAKAESSAVISPVQNLIYANDEILLVTEANVTGGTVYYRVGTDGEWQSTPPTGKDAGDYEVYYYIKGDDNHNDNGSKEKPMGSCKVTIAKKKIEASAKGFEGVYDETASHTIQVTVTDPEKDYNITYSTTKDGTYTAKNPSYTDVGEYTVYYRVEAGKNYETASGSATIKITGAEFASEDITATGYTGTYDGNSHKIFVKTTGTADKATITYSTTGEASSYTDKIPEFTNATNGVQTVYYKVSKKGYTDKVGTVEVSIDRKPVKAVVSVEDKEYDGTKTAVVKATVNTRITGESLTLSGVTGTFDSKDAAENIPVTIDGSKMTVTAGAGTLADNYTVTCEEKTTGKITAKPVKFTWGTTDLTYNGSEQSVTAEVSNKVDADIINLTYDGNSTTDAGKYTATVKRLDNSNYVIDADSNASTDWSIAKAESTFTAPKVISGLTYNGANQILITAGQTSDGTIMYKVSDGKWSDQLPTGLDAGTYNISYKVVGDKNHKDSAEGQLTATIAKKTVVVSGIKAEDKIYDGNTSAALNLNNVKFDGMLEKDSLDITATGTFADKNAGQKKVLISNLVLGGTSAKNYVLAENRQQTETKATIKAKVITATITPNGGTYEGTITPATAVLNGLVGNENPKVTLTYTGTANDGTEADGNMPTHAGTYTVTASITDSNYSLKDEGASAEFVVAKADPVLTVSAVADKNYGDEAFKLETSNKGDGQKSYTSSDEKVATVDKNGLVTIVGAGKTTLTVSLAESANYNAEKKTVTVTIKKINHNLVVEKLTYEVTYGDPAFKITASAGDKETDIKFASNNKDVASVDADGTVTVGNVGTAKITVSMDESQNHFAVSKEITVKVNAKKVTVTPVDTKKHVGKDDPKEFDKKVTGLVGKDTLKGITLVREKGEEPGDYKITVTVDKDANPNYEITPGEGTFTIKGHDWSGEWKTIRKETSWSEGKKEKTCASDGCDQKKYETIPKTGEKEDSNVKKLEKDAEVAPGAPIDQASLDSSKSELLEAPKIFTDGEKEAISAGTKSARVWIEVTPVDTKTDLKPEEIAAIQKEAEKLTGKDSELVYFNADMFKQVGTDKKKQITDPGTKIKLTILIPDELLNHQSNTIRDYKIIRMHDGKAEVLSGTFNSSTKEFTFETDKFSTYAISYKDTYYAPSYPVTDVVMSQEKATLTKEGETLQLTADVKPSYADNKNLTWKSSDEKVATVDKNGKVTAVANGTVTITATSADGKHTATATITVKIAPEKLTVTADKKTLTKIGDSLQITAKVEPDNAYKKLIWKSSDEKVAIVDSNGKVTAVGTGTATITVTTEDGKLSETVTITVKIPDEPTVNETTGYGRLKARSVTQTNNSIKLEWTRVSGADGYIIYGNYCNGNGKTYKYNKITTITNGKTRTWTHTKLKKATYYKYIVKAYKLVNGKKVVTDTSVSVHATTTGGKYGVAKAVSITKIGNKKNVTNVTLKRGKTAQITAKEIKKDRPIRHHRNICYESSNTKVATVTPNGMIQATGKGTCTVWVYAQNGVYKAVTVTVK